MEDPFKDIAEKSHFNIYTSPMWNATGRRFAESIVKECADVLLKWKGEPFPFDEDLAASIIKEHFGVKE